MKAPCESCPPHCGQCAWDHSEAREANGSLVTLRSPKEYGCVNGAAVVVDITTRTPFMQMNGKLHPLSGEFGGVLAGTKLQADIAAIAA